MGVYDIVKVAKDILGIGQDFWKWRRQKKVDDELFGYYAQVQKHCSQPGAHRVWTVKPGSPDHRKCEKLCDQGRLRRGMDGCSYDINTTF